MRFGTFVLQISPDPDKDSEVIDNTLKETELADRLGFDAVWLTEHYFGGDTVYADPLVFGAAVAARTTRVKIGFAVVQMAFHHPVKLAAQTALLDNLSHGRLIVGTGRGSAYNAYEYVGFGISMDEGQRRLLEAEDLLIKSWTETNLKYQGEHWQVEFPMTRPRPYQQPHPPLVRACLSEESIIAMAKIGRPILLGVGRVNDLARKLSLYRDTMVSSGFSETETASALDETWVQQWVYVSNRDKEGQEEGLLAFQKERDHIRKGRAEFNPANYPDHIPTPSPDREKLEHSLIAGSPDRVLDRMLALREVGVQNLLLGMTPTYLAREKVATSMRLFADKVIPALR